ncbi:hypothetical protein D9619_010579 [Psilocybe cf. subviscida]|uniref:F-box domain-containing protein n=1 Tax=Psilocybe cf. subviscida TaxID=2480587 RepID=A0A8H5ASY5_9AGAR|nr:hypothetical protein D9619_010579 [Psilocybe cf. subviscida]
MEPKEAQRLIDEEILVLKTRRNTYAPISRLPSELLVKIFAELRGDDDDDDDDGSGIVDVRAWHHVTHVCRHWRCVALNATILWTKPPAQLHEYTLLMLERSRTTPLKIKLHETTSQDTSTAIFNHLGRIDMLIAQQPKDALDRLQRALLSSARTSSKMKSLQIDQTPVFSGPRFILRASTMRNLTSLTSLWFCGIIIDWQMFPMRGLTDLALIHLRSFAALSFKQFIDVLRGMPRLEKLCFSFDDFQIESPPFTPEPLVMPHLVEFQLHDSPHAVIRSFISHASFPQLQEFYVESRFNQNDDLTDYSATLNAVLPLFTKASFGPLERLVVDRYLIIQPKTVPDHCLGEWQFQFRAYWPDSHPNNGGNIRNTVTSVLALPGNPALDIIYLCLDDLDDLTSGDFVELFGHLPQLETIKINSTHFQPVIDGLKISPIHPSTQPIPFHNLTSLTLNQWRDSEPISANDYSPGLLADLCDHLTTRKQYGAGLRHLSIAWKVTPGEVRRLRDIVVDLKIDVE